MQSRFNAITAIDFARSGCLYPLGGSTKARKKAAPETPDSVTRWVLAVVANDRKALAAVEAEERSSRAGTMRVGRVYEVP